MAVTIEPKNPDEPKKSDDEPKPVRRKRGRPKGAANKYKKPASERPTITGTRKLENRLAHLERRLKALDLENARLRDLADNASLIELVPSPKHTKGEPLTEEEVVHIANGGVAPKKQPRHNDDLSHLLARRAQVGRLLLRGISQVDKARILQVPHPTVLSDIRAIRREWRESVNNYNISEAVGESLMFYREVRDLSVREASNPLNKTTDIIAAANAALKAEDSKNAFLARMGLYDVLDAEKRDAFRQGKTRELTHDAEEFNNVLSFMQAAATSGHTELEDIVEAAEFSDVEPFSDE